MGLFKSLFSHFSAWKYKIDRKILKEYINESIEFGQKEKLPLCDQFYLAKDEKENVNLHIAVINFDAPCDNCLDVEKSMEGTIIFVNKEKKYDPEHDEEFYTTEDFINIKLIDFPESFILYNEYGAPVSLEKYKI